VYETRDGRHVAVGPIEPKFYQEFVERLGVASDDLPGQWETDRWPELRERFAEAFRARTRDEWTSAFEGSDACVAPVLTVAEAAEHPHIAARRVFVDHAGVRQPSAAPRFSRTPSLLGAGPCRLGEHTIEVLREADLTDDEIADLRARGIVGARE
jgi:alpha-methylacyl-CoA racemase